MTGVEYRYVMTLSTLFKIKLKGLKFNSDLPKSSQSRNTNLLSNVLVINNSELFTKS